MFLKAEAWSYLHTSSIPVVAMRQISPAAQARRTSPSIPARFQNGAKAASLRMGWGATSSRRRRHSGSQCLAPTALEFGCFSSDAWGVGLEHWTIARLIRGYAHRRHTKLGYFFFALTLFTNEGGAPSVQLAFELTELAALTFSFFQDNSHPLPDIEQHAPSTVVWTFDARKAAVSELSAVQPAARESFCS